MATQTVLQYSRKSFGDGTQLQKTATFQDTIVPDKPTIPIIAHTMTDEELGLLQGAKIQPVNLNKAVKLLTDPHSAVLYDRHVNALNKVTKHYARGFILKDLVAIFKILNVCADRIDDVPLYMEPMCNILKICSLPFLKEKTSDEGNYKQIAIESISQLGYLMRVAHSAVRLQVCRTLTAFYCETPPKDKQLTQKHAPSSLNYNKQVVEESDVAETLVKSLAFLDQELKVKQSVLSVLQELSRNSAKNCQRMLDAQACTKICSKMMEHDPSGQILFRSTDILWNLLENADSEEVTRQLSNHECVRTLQEAFIQQLTQGYSHYDRQLRNDILVIAITLASMCDDAPFIETGFLKQLTLFATFQEVKSHHALVKHLKLMTNHEDFELKKLLTNMLVVLSKDPAVIPVLSEGRLLLSLLSYVQNNENTSGPREWTPAQFEEIQLHAISALCTLAPLMIDDYMTCQGNTRLLLLLEWCVSTDDYGGHGNSFHGVGGRGNKRAQMRHCLRLLRSVVSTGHILVLQDLIDQGALNQINAILTSVSHSPDEDDAIDVEMQCDMLFIVATLCEGDMHRKELFGVQGVEALVQYLKTDAKKISSGLGHHRLMLSTVDCIWSAVVGCYITEDFFLERDGVFLLIDLLEKYFGLFWTPHTEFASPRNMHNLIVGCTLDLCENTKTVAHVLTWRGKNDQTAAHLFCDIWRADEREIGVERELDGTIADLKNPLMGRLQSQLGVTPLPVQHPSQAIVDVSENMRAKIFALFSKIVHNSKVAIVTHELPPAFYPHDLAQLARNLMENIRYGFTDLPGLTTEDRVTLTIIEKYNDFKVGEVWTEVISELEQEGTRPVTPDNEALETISRSIDELVETTVLQQRDILNSQHSQALLDEEERWAEIRENHKQRQKAIDDFNDYVLRTSNYGFLRHAHERQKVAIEQSRVATKTQPSNDVEHSVSLRNLQTTTFSSRSVKVESTPYSLTGGQLATYNSKEGTLKARQIKKALPAKS